MGMFTQNYYNLFKLRSIMFFNSSYVAGDFQNDPTKANVSTTDIIFTSFSTGLTLNYSLPTNYLPGTSNNIGYYICQMPFYSGALMYGNPTKYNYYGFSSGHYIYFITEDFEETIDNVYTTNVLTYKAVSELITQDGYSSAVNINYTRDDATPLYGLYIVYASNITTSNTPTLMVVYNHKFNNPITDLSFTIQMSFNIANGGINVS